MSILLIVCVLVLLILWFCKFNCSIYFKKLNLYYIKL